jgi:hypothetical protein
MDTDWVWAVPGVGVPGVLEVLRRKLLLLWDKDGQVEEEQALLTLSQVGGWVGLRQAGG